MLLVYVIQVTCSLEGTVSVNSIVMMSAIDKINCSLLFCVLGRIRIRPDFNKTVAFMKEIADNI